jgi:addiction module HigA family antidote
MKSKAPTQATRQLSNPHPGRLLRKFFLEPLGMTQSQLAAATGLPPSRITEVVKERRGITVDSAIRLARVLGPHPQFWLGLQADYDMEEAVKERGREYDSLKRFVPAEQAA